MSSLTAAAPIAAASPATAAAPPVFGARIIIGLVGVLLAVLVSGLNEMVTKVALADIRGALHIGYDEGTWLVASYTATPVAAMAFAPWCSVTFSLRRFTLCAIGLFTLLGVLCPFAPNYESLLLMRILQVIDDPAMRVSFLDALAHQLALDPLTEICRIGDRGEPAGNDSELLGQGLSLSVDGVSADPASCWFFGEMSLNPVERAAHYLGALVLEDGRARFDDRVLALWEEQLA